MSSKDSSTLLRPFLTAVKSATSFAASKRQFKPPCVCLTNSCANFKLSFVYCAKPALVNFSDKTLCISPVLSLSAKFLTIALARFLPSSLTLLELTTPASYSDDFLSAIEGAKVP